LYTYLLTLDQKYNTVDAISNYTKMSFLYSAILLAALPLALSQNCSPITSPAGTPKLAAGYQAKVLMNGLKGPRGMVFDQAGNLLVVERASGGVRQIQLTDGTGLDVCVKSSKQLINDTTVR
jgi:glucose/arabinose dehydrogenase